MQRVVGHSWTCHYQSVRGLLGVTRSVLRLIAALIAITLVACSAQRLDPPPRGAADTLPVLGIPNARFWIDRGSTAIVQEAKLAAQREAVFKPPGANGQFADANFLAISGGGENGAFGAGLLVGWTASGTRPEFKLVTGVSTGALIAPFAFLGPSYDDQLRAVFTGITQEDVYRSRWITAALTDDALADTAPLFSLISRYANERMLADIAREYGRGRLLLIGTTDIDLQRPVLWNIGAIAASGNPKALDLFRHILLASASIPGAFSPVLIDVDYNGKHYQEMHVDGGAVTQTFLYPAAVQVQKVARALGIHRNRIGYIIRNGRLEPDWADTKRQFLSIAGRAVSTMIHYSGANDITRIYFTSLRDGVEYNLAYIGSDFPNEEHDQFDQKYMRALFDYAYEKAKNGYPWRHTPSGLESVSDISPPS